MAERVHRLFGGGTLISKIEGNGVGILGLVARELTWAENPLRNRQN